MKVLLLVAPFVVEVIDSTQYKSLTQVVTTWLKHEVSAVSHVIINHLQ